MKHLLIFILSIVFIQLSYAQNAGMRAYGGITNMTNRVAAITPAGTSHNGYHIGVDGRLNGGGMFFVVGVKFTSIDLIASKESSFFSSETTHYIFGGRVGLGWHLLQFGDGFSIRGKALAQLESNLKYDDEELSVPYDSMVDAAASAVIGLGIQFKILTLDVEYEYGLVNVYSQQKDTKSDAINVSLGFFF